MAKLVSKTYGEALFEAAMESGEDRAAALSEEIRALRGILAGNPEFDTLMEHPGIPVQEKLSVLEEAFGGRLSAEMVNFLKLMVSREHYRQLDAVFDYFNERVKQQLKVGTAYVTTAIELSAAQKAAVEKRLLETGDFRRMEMHYRTDPAVIGGMTVKIGDRVVDSTIRTRLEKMTGQLLQIRLG